MASSIDYVPVNIDMLDDPKVSALLDDLSDGDAAARFAAFGRLVTVLQHVYHNGFYLTYGRFERRKLAKDLDLAPEELDSFLGACVECEIFDARLWGDGVLTSRGIQARYFLVKRKGKASVTLSDEERRYLLDDSAPSRADSREVAPIRADSREVALREEKRRKEKGREEDAHAGAASGLSSSSSLRSLADVPSGGAPLACLAEVADPSASYFDDAGNEHDTPWDALAADFAARTRGQPIGPFAAQVAALCPGDCPRDLGHVEACARLLRRAVARYDPTKGSLFPLARKIIEDERGDPR
ncbi:DUF4373 domain-containing protein [Enorma massiliensis]|uniref:DUF4373 domain-containing protein n=1 Tax=Enorma massiliensis TaxID=1472761 RepID=UPI00195D100F|nr:DUF4373 domain-containing protein [Enorma massiliensis]MBM6784561.1 DUF4373 domain-containing protein [Enorma massiliensis]